MKASSIMSARVEGVDFLKALDQDLKMAMGLSDMPRVSELLELRVDVCKALKKVGFHAWRPPVDESRAQ